MPKAKNIMLYSGGLDSRLLHFWFKKHINGKIDEYILVDYGQINGEIAIASAQLNQFGVPTEKVKLITIAGGVWPDVLGEVPMRNSVMLTVAAARCNGYGRIWAAIRKPLGSYVYIDTTQEFATDMRKLLARQGVRLELPFLRTPLRKSVNELGKHLGAAQSCNELFGRNCGQCKKCKAIKSILTPQEWDKVCERASSE